MKKKRKTKTWKKKKQKKSKQKKKEEDKIKREKTIGGKKKKHVEEKERKTGKTIKTRSIKKGKINLKTKTGKQKKENKHGKKRKKRAAQRNERTPHSNPQFRGCYGTNSESVFDPEQFFKLGPGDQKGSRQSFKHFAKRRVGKVVSLSKGRRHGKGKIPWKWSSSATPECPKLLCMSWMVDPLSTCCQQQRRKDGFEVCQWFWKDELRKLGVRLHWLFPPLSWKSRWRDTKCGKSPAIVVAWSGKVCGTGDGFTRSAWMALMCVSTGSRQKKKGGSTTFFSSCVPKAFVSDKKSLQCP